MLTWESVELGRSADIYRGGSPRPIQDYLTQSRDGVNWIKIGDVAQNAKYINTTKEKIKPEGTLYSRFVTKGDFILSNSMSFGRPYILGINGCIHDGWLTIQNYQEFFDTDFLYYVLGSEETIQQYISMAAGSSVQNLNKEKVSHVVVVKPPISEQRRIAEALSDMDTLLTAMEKLIAKKRDIKQGAMQELLTGKRRLPGFEGEWVERKLEEIAPIIMGQSPDSLYYNDSSEGLPLIQGNADIENRFTITRFYTSKITKLANRGDIIMTVRAPVGEIARASSDCCLGRGVCAIKGSEFLYHYLIFIEPTWSTLSTGSTFDSINSKTLYETRVYCPSNIIEQAAIAEILSDMDAEIHALTAKLKKLRHIKQGMMNELLTGRIHLSDQEQVS